MRFTDVFVFMGLGILLSVIISVLYSRVGLPGKSNWKGWLTGVISLFLVLFSLAWAYASLLENETQAALMGLFVFGVPGLIVAAGAYRFIRLGSNSA